MTVTIAPGWWIIPLVLTIAAWIPTLRYKPSHGGYLPDMTGAFLALASLAGSAFAWMVYFGVLVALS